MNKKNISIGKINTLLRNSSTDDGTFYAALYDLYVLIGLSKGIADFKNEKTISLEDFEKEIEELNENTNKRFG